MASYLSNASPKLGQMGDVVRRQKTGLRGNFPACPRQKALVGSKGNIEALKHRKPASKARNLETRKSRK